MESEHKDRFQSSGPLCTLFNAIYCYLFVICLKALGLGFTLDA